MKRITIVLAILLLASCGKWMNVPDLAYNGKCSKKSLKFFKKKRSIIAYEICGNAGRNFDGKVRCKGKQMQALCN